MLTERPPTSWRALASWPPALRWGALIGLSLLFAGGLEALRLPAAPLLGSMAAAVLLASKGGAVRVTRPIFFAAQGVVGVMIAANLPPTLLGEIASAWPVFLAGTLSTLFASCLLGWLMARSGALPGTTAIWGALPGAATAMTLMSEGYGADMRLVAFMQYLRVGACAVVATFVARLMGTSASGYSFEWRPTQSVLWNAPVPLGIAFIGAGIGMGLRIPGGALLVPMAIGITAKLADGAALALPMPVLATGYSLIGWGIGMRFSPEVLAHAARVFPRVVLSILMLIAICGGFAGILVLFAGIDPLTAYLATSPGGADSVAIIAASTRVDMPFIMAMQVARFLLVLVAGPALARLLSGRNGGDSGAGSQFSSGSQHSRCEGGMPT